MNSITVSLIVFTCVFGGALLGMLLRATLPEHHLGSDSKDIVKLGMGLVGTMAALVLGLLVASAKGSFDVQSTELTQMAANVGLLDRALAQYGPETKEARDMLRVVVARLLDEIWSKDRAGPAPLDPSSFDQMGMLARDQNGGPNFNAKVETVCAISEFVGAYRILGDAPAEQGTGLSSFWLEPLFGVRYYYDHNKLDVRVVQQTTDFAGTRQWADPFLGASASRSGSTSGGRSSATWRRSVPVRSPARGRSKAPSATSFRGATAGSTSTSSRGIGCCTSTANPGTMRKSTSRSGGR
jgi:hypothetical protein